MSNQKPDPSVSQVEEYLQHHPDFFHEHLNLLELMSIPHPSGAAISLISKQLELFRSKHYEMESQLNELIEIARDNDTSFYIHPSFFYYFYYLIYYLLIHFLIFLLLKFLTYF